MEVFGSFGNEPMQSCSVHCVMLSLSSVLAALASALASVYNPPSDSFDHRKLHILHIYAAISLVYAHKILGQGKHIFFK